MAKGLTVLADMRREEHYKQLMEMPERDMYEMIRAHFESHPTLPGEKILKDTTNQLLTLLNENEPIENIEIPFGEDNLRLVAEEKRKDLANQFAKTRIRETTLKEGLYYLDFRHFDPTALKRHEVDILPQEQQADIIVERVDVELQRNDAGEVYVLAEQSDGGYRTIGSLPDNFLKNNPMNVESCAAELQIVDYSNGKMKNLSAKVVVDTDLMSGDVIDLNEDMFAGLNHETGLEQ